MNSFNNNFLSKKSFRFILSVSFIFVSIAPIFFLQLIFASKTSDNLQDNINHLSYINVEQVKNNLELSLGSYEDILYQLYTNDKLISYVQNIEKGNETTLNTNQLNRILHEMCYAKEHIEAVTVITMSGKTLFSDKLKASYLYSSWIDSYDMPINDILAIGMKDFQTKFLPAHFATSQGSKPYYLFHIVHRIIDHKDVDKEIGVVVLSLGEEVLSKIGTQINSDSFHFIVDSKGRIISYPLKSRIGENLENYNDTDKTTMDKSLSLLLNKDGFLEKYIGIYTSNSLMGWRVVCVLNQSGLYEEINAQQKAFFLMGFILIAIIAMIIFSISTKLSRSMKNFEITMEKAIAGDLTAYVSNKDMFSREMSSIAKIYNEMLKRIKELIEESTIAALRQKDAEIKALEAQINPHFLYNILDSINWIAIDKSQFEISGMITSLAKILRYSINNSNGIVALRDEIDWLKRYLYLQRMRFKNNFDYSFDIDEELLDYPIHKMIFQPFVENSIIHGFSFGKEKNILMISIRKTESIEICIHDNGRGMDSLTLDRVQNPEAKADMHIGMSNAIGRIKMYYGKNAKVTVESRIDDGTTVKIYLDYVKCEN